MGIRQGCPLFTLSCLHCSLALTIMVEMLSYNPAAKAPTSFFVYGCFMCLVILLLMPSSTIQKQTTCTFSQDVSQNYSRVRPSSETNCCGQVDLMFTFNVFLAMVYILTALQDMGLYLFLFILRNVMFFWTIWLRSQEETKKH